VLLECNISGETSKSGFAAAQRSQWAQLVAVWEAILKLPGLEVRGLMTMAPQVARPELARPYFAALRELRDWIAPRLAGCAWAELSMGMTDDFEPAVECGATIVRVGRAIFGERG
jgi:PLP dependent protein